MNRRRIGLILLGAVIIAVAGIVGYFFFGKPAPKIVSDRLCEYVRDQEQMNCVAVLAADDFVHPGAILAYQPTATPANDRIPLPVANLIGSSCLIPGASPEITAAASKPVGVSIPQFTYETNGALEVGADVEIPQLYGAIIKAGPRWSDVQKIALSVEEAWITQLDENLAVQAVRSCSIRKECVDRIRTQQYRVVATSLVAKGLDYKFYGSSGSLIPLDAAAKSDEFTASIGASSDVKSTTDATLRASAPRVVGVRLLPADLFKEQPVCDKTVLFSVSGTASVSIDGGGGHGALGGMRTVQKPINETAQLSASGSEKSECQDNFERKVSSANAMARVESAGDGKLRLTYNIAAAGGHYVTVAGCPAGVVLGKTGHDTSATAAADLVGTIFVLVRSETSPTLHVDWNNKGGEKASVTIRVLDWNSEPLRDLKGAVIGEIPADASGNIDLTTRGPGLYRVETRVQLSASVGGNVNDNKQQTADVTVSAL